MRRVPYIVVKDNKLIYICPKCKKGLPRDMYKMQEWCPYCEHPLNQTSKGMLKVYKILDKEFYDYFIDTIRRQI